MSNTIEPSHRSKNVLLKKLSKNLIFFVLSKGVAFLAPIFFIKFVSLEEYGLIEFSYSFGSVTAVILTLGLGGAYPYFILKKKEEDKEQLFYFHSVFVVAVWLIFATLFYFNIISINIYLPLLFCTVFALQRLYSAILKSKDKGYLAVLYDGGYYFLLSSIILLALVTKAISPTFHLRILMEIYLVVLFIIYIYNFLKVKTVSYKTLLYTYYPTVLKFSSSLILSGFLIFCLTSTPRIYIKYLLGFEEVGIYSFYFRLAGIAVVINMFISITFFKKLYLSDPKKLDQYFSSIMLIICIVGLMCYAFSPIIVEYLFPEFLDKFGDTKLLLLLCLQMPIWVGISLNESIVSREALVPKMNIRLVVIAILIPITLFFFKGIMTLQFFTIIYIFFFCVAYASQILLLRRKQIYFNRCLAYCIISFVVSITVFFLY